MKKLLLFAGAALLATTAHAVSWTAVPGGPDPGPAPGQTLVVTFDAPMPFSYLASGDYAIQTGLVSGVAAPPAGDATAFFYVSSALGSGVATLNTPNLKSFSFNWGSVDTYNTVDILGAGGVTLLSLSGASLPLSNGDQFNPLSNPRVFFNVDPGEVITGARFKSTGVAFEIDNIAGTRVPEPASWALMVTGLGFIGFALRRRPRGITAHVTA